MIVITDIEFSIVEDSMITRIQKRLNKIPIYSNKLMAQNSYLRKEDFNIDYEVVEGTIFHNNNGEEICLGACEEVQEFIGLPFSIFQAQRAEINELTNRVLSKEKTIIKLCQNWNLWNRLKFFFNSKVLYQDR